ncbi:MAG TPA: aminoglycoside adenylyltransferase domain-containing protein [Ornithinimicrobium sp.]|uniref:aminoglycoside adenylyltransferase domain-containing protein n=1 Tax=Ornithinimicrobium sp. TaxID=1977084 RepID=UPI002B47D258|nr:aminoglycoside adenylyltransferase domain-containing protein [Ornithinimicrobium sp.]HKJ12866.1 aminoglycoside adenylyltransferase domain-containing protein [Ornithinimicrobium sp.]
MVLGHVVTPYPDLDRVLGRLLADWRRILGDNLAGAYVQGSFALGAGDRHSDCDWLVATRAPLDGREVEQLGSLHHEVPSREGEWWGELEGSYAPLHELVSVEHLGAAWLFNDHGHPTVDWDEHCNRAFTRWILREHGLRLYGPEPRSFMPEVPASALRREAARSLPTLLSDLTSWVDIDTLAWGQRYAVATACRVLYTLEHARVASKHAALEWGLRALDPQWRPLLGQVRDERARGWEPERAPRPGEAGDARAFVAYAMARAGSADLG